MTATTNGAGQTTSYASNADGQVTTITYPLPGTATWPTNNYVTYGYDHAGRPNRTVSPTGAITRMVYNALGEVVSVWVGTNDTPTSGAWSPYSHWYTSSSLPSCDSW